MAHVGLYLVERGLEPQERRTFEAGLDLLDNLVERSTTTAPELDLLRQMVAAHDRQREQIGRGDYLKALKALQLDAEPDPGRLRAVFRVQMKGMSDCDGAFDGTQETGSEKYPLITTPSQSF